jgi:hypothetical protein
LTTIYESSAGVDDRLLDRALALTAAVPGAGEAVDELLALAQYRRPPIDRARGRCLKALDQRPPNTRALLCALDLIDEALDRLDVG